MKALETLQARVEECYARQTQKKQFDPAIIALILQVIMGVVSNCIKKPATMLETAKKHPVLARVRIRQVMKDCNCHNRADSDDICETALAVADKSTIEEIVAVNDEINFVM